MSAVSAAPLTLGELSTALAAIGGFEARPFIAVAVSGGPDSLALTILADRWARSKDMDVNYMVLAEKGSV